MVEAAKGSELPPYERFAQFRRYYSVGLLPNGDAVYSTDTTGRFDLWRGPVGADGRPGYPVALTALLGRSVRTFAIAPDGRWVYFAADPDGDEQFQLYRVPSAGGEVETITAQPSVRHELGVGGVHPSGRSLLYCDNGRDPKDLDVILHELRTGRTERPFFSGKSWARPAWDPAGRRISAAAVESNNDSHLFVVDPRRTTTTELLPHTERAVVDPVGWTRDGKAILVRTDLDGEFFSLARVDLADGRKRTVVAPRWDVEEAVLSSAGRTETLSFVVNEDGYSTLHTGPVNGPFRRVSVRPAGCLVPFTWGERFAVTPDGRRAAMIWNLGNRPAELVAVDLVQRRSSFLTDSMVGGVPGGPLRPPTLVRFPTFDGRKVPAFYYRPKRRPAGRMPAVLAIHGGPESQERPTFGLYQFLNSRGIAVLAPNIRGSVGYGKSYQRLILRDWGGGELQDLAAAADWLRAQPEVDPDRLGVYGGSFGGFATLSCLTRLPQYWTVGVDLFGPSNLVTFCRSVPAHWQRTMRDWVGDVETEAERLRERSPITYLDRVRADVLVIQGAKDPRVVQAESDQMVEKLRSMGRTVDYLVFPDEGHGFTRTENALRAIGAAGDFLVRRLAR